MTPRQPLVDGNLSIPSCPTCRGRMEIVYDRPTAMVAVCVDCHSGITVPRNVHASSATRGQLDLRSASSARADLTKCPVCGFRMKLLSQNLDYVSLGCDSCHVSVSLSKPAWEDLTTRRESF